MFGTDAMPAYKFVFIASGIGMLISLVWFWFGRRQLAGIGRPAADGAGEQTRALRAARRARGGSRSSTSCCRWAPPRCSGC